MSFDVPYSTSQNTAQPRRRRIAIIGGGISGLASAWLLSADNDVTLYEAAPRLGGHARTVMAGLRGDQPVDTGFIVFNYVNYPHLTRMFKELDVPVEPSNMTFGATIGDGLIEYGLDNLRSVFGQKRNIARPAYYRMLRDILRFNAQAERVATSDDITIGDLIHELRLGDWFRRYYLMPICGAIWSTPTQDVTAFPAKTLVQFFRNHALLSARGQHQWWTVKGGSVEYVKRLVRALKRRGVTLHTSSPILRVSRNDTGPTLNLSDDKTVQFDEVVFACHSDETLKLLSHPTQQERAALGVIGYQDNTVILHRDEKQMPRRRACWSSWVYKAQAHDQNPAIGVTYWMNQLQNIDQRDPLFVSLNPVTPVQDDLIYDQVNFRHPVFDRAAITAQSQIQSLQGQNHTWFAGAYLRHGFHEDGFVSAVRVARGMQRQNRFQIA